jgi:hypothetical protein
MTRKGTGSAVMGIATGAILTGAWMVAGCGNAAGTCPPNFDPAAGATWNGTFYAAAAPLPASVQLARPAPGARSPRCSGQIAVVVHQIKRVDPRLPLAELRPRRTLLIAPGFLSQLRDFPLRHALWHRAASIRDYNRRCHERRTFDGRVWSGPDPSDPDIEIRLGRGRFLFLVVPPDATVDAATIAGQPHIVVKQRIIGSGRSCGHREVLVGRLRTIDHP